MLTLTIVLAVVILSLLANFSMNRKIGLETVKVPVMALDRTFENFTVLQISDLHAAAVGKDADAWRSLLYGKSFSAAVLTGDMVGTSGDAEPLLALIATLRQINSSAAIYFVAGDDDPEPVMADYRGTPEVIAPWVKAAQDAGAVYLDAPQSLQVGKRTVWFTPEYVYSMDPAGMAASLTRQKEEMESLGKQYEAGGGASYRALCYRLDTMNRCVAAIKEMTMSDLQIAVAHVPLAADYVRTAVEWADQSVVFNFRNVSLMMAGHYVAGQWRLPGIGPIYVPELGWFPGDENVVGMQRINSINQYINAGVGASNFYPMPGRLFNTPSVALLSLTAKIE
jgi:predicted MPP superfamily phosphohydrolase